MSGALAVVLAYYTMLTIYTLLRDNSKGGIKMMEHLTLSFCLGTDNVFTTEFLVLTTPTGALAPSPAEASVLPEWLLRFDTVLFLLP